MFAVLVGAALTISGVGLAAAGAATAIVSAVNIAGAAVPVLATDWSDIGRNKSVDLDRIPVGVQINVVADNRYEVTINVRGTQPHVLDFYNMLIHWTPPFAPGDYAVDRSTGEPPRWRIPLSLDHH